ncbi:MAG: hypothetical protein AAF577_00580 [Pseudomonadota bacterium]
MSEERGARLAIMVAYYVDEALWPMVSIHLDRIARHTTMPFTIYGAAIRMQPAMRRRLEERGVVVAPTEGLKTASVRAEHAHALEVARRRALEDGPTLFVTLHQDSFPIVDGWDSRLSAQLDAGAAFAAIVPYSYNACKFWGRAWQDRAVPFYADELNNDAAAREAFVAAHPGLDPVDNGAGWVKAATDAGLRWEGITARGALIWGDVLHLVSATTATHSTSAPAVIPAPLRGIRRFINPLMLRLPGPWREWIRSTLRAPFRERQRVVHRGGGSFDVSTKREAIDRLIADPEGFVAGCLSEAAPATTQGAT